MGERWGGDLLILSWSGHRFMATTSLHSRAMRRVTMNYCYYQSLFCYPMCSSPCMTSFRRQTHCNSDHSTEFGHAGRDRLLFRCSGERGSTWNTLNPTGRYAYWRSWGSSFRPNILRTSAFQRCRWRGWLFPNCPILCSSNSESFKSTHIQPRHTSVFCSFYSGDSSRH